MYCLFAGPMERRRRMLGWLLITMLWMWLTKSGSSKFNHRYHFWGWNWLLVILFHSLSFAREIKILPSPLCYALSFDSKRFICLVSVDASKFLFRSRFNLVLIVPNNQLNSIEPLEKRKVIINLFKYFPSILKSSSLWGPNIWINNPIDPRETRGYKFINELLLLVAGKRQEKIICVFKNVGIELTKKERNWISIIIRITNK